MAPCPRPSSTRSRSRQAPSSFRSRIAPRSASTGAVCRDRSARPAGPWNRLRRQRARCAREYRCPAARDALLGQRDGPLQLGARANDEAAPLVALRRRDERAPLLPTALKVSAGDAAAVAIAHLAGGGASVSFGHACEGDPLGLVRDVIDATTRIKRASSNGLVVVRTS